jgi:hypothetical protein
MGEVLQLQRQGMFRQALFSEDRVYRYTLTRVWDADKARCCFVLLNPSTADERKEDPTIRRCIAYARAWDFGGLEILNLFAFRSTNPQALRMIPDPFGPMNMEYIATVTRATPLIVCGWGGSVPLLGQDKRVLQMLHDYNRPVSALKVNESDKSPSHPLYLRGDLVPQPYIP